MIIFIISAIIVFAIIIICICKGDGYHLDDDGEWDSNNESDT